MMIYQVCVIKDNKTLTLSFKLSISIIIIIKLIIIILISNFLWTLVNPVYTLCKNKLDVYIQSLHEYFLFMYFFKLKIYLYSNWINYIIFNYLPTLNCFNLSNFNLTSWNNYQIISLKKSTWNRNKIIQNFEIVLTIFRVVSIGWNFSKLFKITIRAQEFLKNNFRCVKKEKKNLLIDIVVGNMYHQIE